MAFNEVTRRVESSFGRSLKYLQPESTFYEHLWVMETALEKWKTGKVENWSMTLPTFDDSGKAEKQMKVE